MAALKSLSEIFSNTLYRIPDYQRGYAWTPNQLKDFWDDLHNLHESKQHYTGVLTVKLVPSEISLSDKWNEEHWLLKERGYKAYYVVDGQQRLTTSIIFIQSLVEVVGSLPQNRDLHESDIYIGSYSIKDIRETYLLISKPPHNIIRTYKFGYESDNPSFRFLRYRIFNEDNSGTVDETFYTLNLENAKKFFKEKLRGVLTHSGEDDVVELFRKMTVNFRFNVYEIEEDFDVFVAFETMNNRGKKLSNLELLKNRLIYLTTLYEPHDLKEDDRISLRTKIDDAWKEVYYQLGRNKNYPLNDDDFLVAHWIMYFQYSRQKGDDYINFLLNDQFTPKNIFDKIDIPVYDLEGFEVLSETEDDGDEDTVEDEDTATVRGAKLRPKEIEDYVNSLKSAAVHWYNSFNPVGNSQLKADEQLWIDRLNRIGISYFRPLVTSSFLNDTIEVKDRIKLFKAIERLIFIAFRLKGAFSNYRNSEFYRAARLLRKGEWTVDAVINLLDIRLGFSFYSNEGETAKWFDYGFFKKYVDKHFQNGGGFYWWNGLRYFLYEYEMDLVRHRGSQKIDWSLFVKNEGDKVSIEHILPQTPTKSCWKAILKGHTKNEISRLQGTLGNLLPLSRSINSSLQNDCFDEKKVAKLDEKGNQVRMGYHNGSHSEIEVSMKPIWSANEIMERGIDMLDFMERRWDLRFESVNDKLELLNISFLVKETTE
ncbi:DUF262 domain-containing protein [Flaviaesturariibacter flavus]|uniref:DUF262 domain-containing protein n=1 Tax=Flaviaesturariibacter flavus TaxID=2502780 RepID=A0A4R1BIG1_9BACT|nr:DUF262 domain-containing protein [Flaviaesturariibacter flavus]TCJ17070.1 DUF262 domain-containing protein [Flaviaesturariibacter flavus]